jgi:hypothetical protein
MASTLSLLERQRLLDALGTQYGFAAAYTGDPGTTGTANEVTGGTPAYARKAITWSSASGATPSVKALAATFPVFDIPSGTTVAYIGIWTADTGGTYGGCWDVTDEVFAAQGTYTLTAGSISL